MGTVRVIGAVTLLDPYSTATQFGGVTKSVSIEGQHTQQHRRSQLTIDRQVDKAVQDTYVTWGQKLKGLAIEDLAVQSLLDLQKGSKASRLKRTNSDTILYSSSSDETDDADESDMDLSDDNPPGDDDDARYRVFIYNKSTHTLNSTYLSPTFTSSSLDFIQTMLDETPENKLTDFMSHPVYTNAHTTSVVYKLEGNPEVRRFQSGASEVPFGTHVDVQATNHVLQKMFTEVTRKFKECDQKLEALTNFNVSEAFEKAVHTKVLTKIKKLLPTHIPDVIANYLKLLNRIHSNKSIETHATHQQLYDTLYDSITLDQEALDAQAAQSSFHKRTHDNQDLPNNCEGENKKKRRKDAEWFLKKSGLVERRTTWLDLFLKSDIDKNENHILRPSTIAIAKKFKELIQKDELTIADLESAGLERLKVQYNNDVELKYHVSQLKAAVLTKAHIHHWEEDIIDFFRARISVVTKGDIYSDLRIKSIASVVAKKKWGNGFITSIVVRRSDDKEYAFSYVDLPKLSLNDVEDMYLLQVQDKLYHLPLEFVKDFNNAPLMFIRRTVIKKRAEDIQLGIESYQRTLNLTKPTMFFEGIDQRMPFTMTLTHKRVVYLNQFNVKSLMKLSEVNTFCDGTLTKIQENLIEMLSRNKVGKENKRLKGRDWTDYDIKSSKEMLRKIDETLQRASQKA
ncbi:hypothetical protein Tco_0992411 [Tanacetum coccineum]|uniref:Uncharacterized protein n=1 Tax=Tanacetum coccineum TaxID=301880 RepID=A0ABQ5F3P9_9ASTR